MMMVINENILDMKLRPQVVHLFLQMIYNSEDGLVVASQSSLMEWTQCKDKETNISYVNELLENDLISFEGLTDRKKTNRINNKYYFYK